MLTLDDVAELSAAALERVSEDDLAGEIGISVEDLRRWRGANAVAVSELEAWRLLKALNKYGMFDLLPAHGIPPVSYNIAQSFNLPDPPVGYEMDPPLVPLRLRRTEIAGLPVGFPMALPASVLAANSHWISFYAQRGFDILTYKTVRSIPRAAHEYPNWVFLKDPAKLSGSNDVAVGEIGFWPDDKQTTSMANSFGVPSFGPDWWQADVRKAKESLREHQILIVSVVATETHSVSALTADFVRTAQMAKAAGADIVEANFSCPNVPGDPAGEVYLDAELSGRIAEAMREGLDGTPLLAKIGYLPRIELQRFVAATAPHLAGIVAINTISAVIKTPNGDAVFPGRPRAGVSGWAIRERALEVCRQLAELRDDIWRVENRKLTIIGMGGILEPSDCDRFFETGVDAVGSCTGAFLDPYLALRTRLDTEALGHRSSRIMFELRVMGKLLAEVIKNPTRDSVIRVNRETRRVEIERD